MRRWGWAIGVVLLAGLVFGYVSGSSPLPPLAAAIPDWPLAAPPSGMSLVHLPTGIVHRNAAMAYRGGSFRDKREFTMSAVLVRHPQGDLLIDTGFGRDIDRKIELMPFWFRALTSYTRLESAAQQLDRNGYDRKRLRAVVLTHAHWDHASGLGEFRGTPVWVEKREREFIAHGDFSAAVARSIGNVHYEIYTFANGPFLGFPARDTVRCTAARRNHGTGTGCAEMHKPSS